MSGLVCPKCRVAVAGADVITTAWMLCPWCGEMIDTSAPPPAPPAPPSVSAPAAAPEAPEAPDAPKEFEEPKEPERRRAFKRAPAPEPMLEWQILRLFVLVFGTLAVCGGAGYVAWQAIVFSPSFTEHTAPNGEFSISFPGSPEWDRSELSGAVTRKYGLASTEYYHARVQQTEVSFEGQSRASVERFVLRSALNRLEDHPTEILTAPRTVKVPVGAGAEYESWVSGSRHWKVTRFIIIGQREVHLTVGGPAVRMNDRRVQKFFNSFRYHQAPPPDPEEGPQAPP